MNKIVKEDLEYIISANLPWENFENKVILVSGANGMLPAYMVETLLYLNKTRFRNKVKVIGIVRNKEKAYKRFLEYKDREDLVLIVQDICSDIKICEHVDFIIHAASQASPKYYGKDPVGTLLPNIIGTCKLLEFARKIKVEDFLFFSSGGVYGEVSEKIEKVEEDDYGALDPLNIRSCYAESKRMAENMCACWYYQYGVPVKIVRPFHTYGYGMTLDDGRVFADFVSDILYNRDIVLKSDGRAVRAFCYLSDATLGFFTVMLKGARNEAYNVGNDSAVTSIANLANELVNIFPLKKLKVVRDFAAQNNGYIKSNSMKDVPDVMKLHNLGWFPRYSINEGFKRTIMSLA